MLAAASVSCATMAAVTYFLLRNDSGKDSSSSSDHGGGSDEEATRASTNVVPSLFYCSEREKEISPRERIQSLLDNPMQRREAERALRFLIPGHPSNTFSWCARSFDKRDAFMVKGNGYTYSKACFTHAEPLPSLTEGAELLAKWSVGGDSNVARIPTCAVSAPISGVSVSLLAFSTQQRVSSLGIRARIKDDLQAGVEVVDLFDFSAGAKAWLLGRASQDLVFCGSLECRADGDVREKCMVSYAPQSARHPFEITIESANQGDVVKASYVTSLSFKRSIANPFAPPHHATITNYFDVGFDVAQYRTENTIRARGFAAWQANEKILFKAEISKERVAMAAEAKAFMHPNIAVSICAEKKGDKGPRVGFSFDAKLS